MGVQRRHVPSNSPKCNCPRAHVQPLPCSRVGFFNTLEAVADINQLLQFVTIACQSAMSLSRGDSCGAPYFGKIGMVAYMGSMLLLFGNFFFRSYILKKDSKFGDGVVKAQEPI